MNQFETIQDGALDNVTGGLSFSLGIDTESGISLETPVGSLSVNPIGLATDVLGAAETVVKKLLNTVGAAFTKLGQIFNFS